MGGLPGFLAVNRVMKRVEALEAPALVEQAERAAPALAEEAAEAGEMPRGEAEEEAAAPEATPAHGPTAAMGQDPLGAAAVRGPLGPRAAPRTQ